MGPPLLSSQVRNDDVEQLEREIERERERERDGWRGREEDMEREVEDEELINRDMLH
jgi:hypothetical protein